MRSPWPAKRETAKQAPVRSGRLARVRTNLSACRRASAACKRSAGGDSREVMRPSCAAEGDIEALHVGLLAGGGGRELEDLLQERLLLGWQAAVELLHVRRKRRPNRTYSTLR